MLQRHYNQRSYLLKQRPQLSGFVGGTGIGEAASRKNKIWGVSSKWKPWINPKIVTREQNEEPEISVRSLE